MKQTAYEALTEWERTGELPDPETHELVCIALVSHEWWVDRYRKLIDECHNAEHLRRLPTSSLLLSEKSSTAKDARDSSRSWLQSCKRVGKLLFAMTGRRT